MAFLGFGYVPTMGYIRVPVPIGSLGLVTPKICRRIGCYETAKCGNLCILHSCPLCGQEKSSVDVVCSFCALKSSCRACQHFSEHGKCLGIALPGSQWCAHHNCPRCSGEKASDDFCCNRCKSMTSFRCKYSNYF
jgi:hypothetical protein